VTGVIVDGVYSELGDVEEPTYGFPVLSKRDRGNDHGWVRFYDGTQTAADPTLVAKYGGRTDIPWSEDHIGTGVPYVIFSAWASSKVFPNGAPEQRYERTGIPFYDPRKDSSVGGAGAHRWNDWSTWETTANPVVMIYNILRGLNLPDGSVWGGEAEADDVPLPIWVPGMDVCDVDVDGRPQYEAGYEIHFAEDTPGEVIDELLASCNAQIAEFGGFFYIQVGAPDFAVATITDDDLLVSDSATKDPFPELQNIFNRVTAKYVSPGALWNGTPIDMIRNEEWEVEDGARRTFELDLPAVFNPAQAGQLAEDVLRDQRRWRKHGWPLPPDYSNLRPLSTVNVTSAWNGYDNKLFEVTEIALDLRTLSVVVSLRERDPDDFVINPALEIPDRTSILPIPVPTDAGLPGFWAKNTIVSNEDGTILRPGVAVGWDISEIAETIKGIAIECQVRATEEEIWSGTLLDLERNGMIIQPVPRNADLRVRAKPLADNRRGEWTAWVFVTTDDIGFTQADLADALRTQIDTAFDRHDAVLGAEGVPQSVQDLFDRVMENIAPIGPTDTPETTLFERLTFEEPQLRDAVGAVRSLEDRLIEADLAQFSLSRRMVDAGIYADPDSGAVRIAGVAALEGRQSDVEISLDAMTSTIALKASLTEVNDAIAAAQLDPTDLASLTDLTLRVTDAEIAIDAAAATITSLTETLTVEGGLVTMTSVTGRLDSLEGTIILKVDQTEFDGAEARLSDAEILLDAIDVPSITFEVSQQRFLRDAAQENEDATVEGLIGAWLSGQALREAAASGERQLTAFVSEGFEAEAKDRLVLNAKVDQARADLASEETARATADAAEASARSVLEASLMNDIGAVNARVANVEATRVTASGAVAAVTQEISASYGDLAAMASATAFSEATLDGISSGFVWSLGEDDVLSLVQVDDGTTEPVTTARIKATYIRLDGDVEVTGDFLADKIFATDVLVERLTVTDEMVAPGAISNVINDYFFSPVSNNVTISGGSGSATYSGTLGTPGSASSFGTIQGIVTNILRGRSTLSSPAGFGGWFQCILSFDGATFTTYTGAIMNGELQMRYDARRGAGSAVSSWKMDITFWDVPAGNIEILSRGFLVAEIKK